jgi:hypothetical protein
MFLKRSIGGQNAQPDRPDLLSGICWPLLFLFLLSLSSMSSCGYRVASENRVQMPFRSIAIEPLESDTTTFKVEQFLTRSLVREFVEKSYFEVINDSRIADAVLWGRVHEVRASPITFARSGDFGSTFLVSLRVSLLTRDRKTKEIVYQMDDYSFREQYVVNIDVENFFTEENPALLRIARDFAESAVSTILEGF